VPEDVAEEGTVRREAVRAPAHAPEDQPAAGHSEISPVVLLSVVGVVVLALVGGLVWALVGRGGGGEPTPGPTHTVAGPSDDSPFQVPQVPTVGATAVAGGVRFAWTYPGAQRGDTFLFRVASRKESLPQATWQPVKETTRTVRASKGALLCAQAEVVRGGVNTSASDISCERAG
jgi:hypothetical protein